MKFVKILDNNFEMSAYQTTQKYWCEVIPSNPSSFVGVDNPVENVSWNDAKNFIDALNYKQSEHVYRLPTVEEWKYCCRARSASNFYFGDSEEELKDYAWFCENSNNKTHPVGEKKPNAFGLYDMYGNVWEWCEDLYSRFGSDRVLMGGCWHSKPEHFYSMQTGYSAAGYRGYSTGFRLVRTGRNEKIYNLTLLNTNVRE